MSSPSVLALGTLVFCIVLGIDFALSLICTFFARFFGTRKERSPHRRPQIRLVPGGLVSNSAPNLSTSRTGKVQEKTASPAIVKLRRAQRALGWRRRASRNSKVRVSFQRSATKTSIHQRPSHKSSGRASQRCKLSTPAEEWLSLQGLPAANELPPIFDTGRYPQLGPSVNPFPHHSRQYHPALMRMSKVTRLVDEEDSRYSLMQVPMPSGLVPHAKTKPEYAHVGQLDGAVSDSYQAPEPAENRCDGVASIPCVDGSHESKDPHGVALRDGCEQKHDSSQSKREKHMGLADPEAWESVRRSLSQQQRLSSVITSPKQTEFPLEPFASPSRTSSQRKSLDRFTRQLEKYYLATGGECKLPISTPTLTESRASVHTVIEFLPYHSEFQAAGLAITSEEQTPEKKKKQNKMKKPVADESKLPPLSDRSPLNSKETVSGGEASSDQRTLPSAMVKVASGNTRSNVKPMDIASVGKKTTKSRLPWSRKQDQPLPPIPPDEEDKSNAQMYARLRSVKPHVPPAPTGYWDVLGEFVASPPTKDPTQSTSGTGGDTRPPRASLDKPLPKPPVFHRPLPQRSGRRHMENTSQWPTAGVLIHDHTPIILEASKQAGAEPSLVRSKPPSSKGASLPSMGADGGSSLSSQRTKNMVVRPRGKGLVHGQSKLNGPPGLPSTILEEPVFLAKQPRRPAQGLSRQHHQDQVVAPPPPPKDPIISKLDEASVGAGPCQDAAPKLPCTWEGTVESSSSFEKALDGIIEMLNDMDHRRQQERLVNFEAARGLSSGTKISSSRHDDSPRKRAYETQSNNCDPSSNVPLTSPPSGSDLSLDKQPDVLGDLSYDDRDINDKDVLHSLRMVVCAACNEELDAWIRSKTGLRLRRFLADLKTFEDLRENEEQTKSVTSKARPRSTRTAKTNGQRKRRSRVDKRQSRSENSKLAAAPGRT